MATKQFSQETITHYEAKAGGGQSWFGNTITPSAGIDLSSVYWYLRKHGSPGIVTFTLQVWATSGGLPTGSALTSKAISSSLLTFDGWNEFLLDSTYELATSTKYGITIHCTNWGDAIGSDYYDVGYTRSDLYAGGNKVGSDDGSSWGSNATWDMGFQVWGDLSYSFDPPVPSGLNMMKTIRRLAAAANNRIWYEDI